MKLKFLQFEYEFTNEDARIVVPVILLILALSTTQASPEYLISVAAAYYLIYFFGPKPLAAITEIIKKHKFRCQDKSCKSRRMILQGYQGYHSDEHYPYYLCKDCKTTHVLLDSGLVIS